MENEIKSFSCVLCGNKLSSKELLQEHFRKHANKEIDNKGRPINKEIIKNENTICLGGSIKDKIECDVCKMNFQTVTQAIQHKFRKHPESSLKYYCPFCGMQFPLKFTRDKHVQNHQGMSSVGSFPCTDCNVIFHNTGAQQYHIRSVHKRIASLFKPIPTPPPSKKIKINSANEVHSVYYCYLCGSEYVIKFNLQKHLERAHSEEERNSVPQDLIKCTTCDALFYNKKAYDTHNMYHRPDDLYVTSEEQRLQTVTRVDQDFDIRRVQLTADKFIPLDKPKRPPKKIELKTNEALFKSDLDEELSPTSSIESTDSENEEKSSQKKLTKLIESQKTNTVNFDENQGIETKVPILIHEDETINEGIGKKVSKNAQNNLDSNDTQIVPNTQNILGFTNEKNLKTSKLTSDACEIFLEKTKLISGVRKKLLKNNSEGSNLILDPIKKNIETLNSRLILDASEKLSENNLEPLNKSENTIENNLEPQNPDFKSKNPIENQEKSIKKFGNRKRKTILTSKNDDPISEIIHLTKNKSDNLHKNVENPTKTSKNKEKTAQNPQIRDSNMVTDSIKSNMATGNNVISENGVKFEISDLESEKIIKNSKNINIEVENLMKNDQKIVKNVRNKKKTLQKSKIWDSKMATEDTKLNMATGNDVIDENGAKNQINYHKNTDFDIKNLEQQKAEKDFNNFIENSEKFMKKNKRTPPKSKIINLKSKMTPGSNITDKNGAKIQILDEIEKAEIENDQKIIKSPKNKRKTPHNSQKNTKKLKMAPGNLKTINDVISDKNGGQINKKLNSSLSKQSVKNNKNVSEQVSSERRSPRTKNSNPEKVFNKKCLKSDSSLNLTVKNKQNLKRIQSDENLIKISPKSNNVKNKVVKTPRLKVVTKLVKSEKVDVKTTQENCRKTRSQIKSSPTLKQKKVSSKPKTKRKSR